MSGSLGNTDLFSNIRREVTEGGDVGLDRDGADVDDVMDEQDAAISDLSRLSLHSSRALPSEHEESVRADDALAALNPHLFAGVRQDVRGSIARGTLKAYNGQIQRYKKWVNAHMPEELRDTTQLSASTPEMICSWIKFYCGKSETPTSTRESVANCEGGFVPNKFSSAVTMRAAANYYYVVELGNPPVPFARNSVGKWAGNPTNSEFVRRYMRSLKRQKSRDGETESSVRALNTRDLEALYRVNASVRPPHGVQRNNDTPKGRLWAGWRQRLMLSAMYAVGFMCLLRLDEVVNLQVRDIRFHDNPQGKTEITLRMRKTQQDGGVEPFFLYYLEKEPWLNVPMLLKEWMRVSGIKDGYIFRPFFSTDQLKIPDFKNNQPALSHTTFLSDFRRNLDEIGLIGADFGGHSLRRGGTQYFIEERGWNIRKLCQYGGWSTEFDPATILRYVISVYDETGRQREDYLDPDFESLTTCPHCGRAFQ